MGTDIIQWQAARRETFEDDKRIVANTRKGEAELEAGLGKRFQNADEFIEHLAKSLNLLDLRATIMIVVIMFMVSDNISEIRIDYEHES